MNIRSPGLLIRYSRASIGLGNFLLIAIIVFLLFAAFGGATDAWWLLGLMAVGFIASLIYFNYKSNRELKRMRGELEEDGNKNLVLYTVIGIIIVVGIAAFCIISGQQKEEPSRPPLTEEQIRVRDSIRAEARMREAKLDSMMRASKKANKEAHEESIRQMARDIVNSGNSSSRSDNMRGWDPASEDDADENGMDRYMENDDDEGWD